MYEVDVQLMLYEVPIVKSDLTSQITGFYINPRGTIYFSVGFNTAPGSFKSQMVLSI
jgi:hypothetical protein